MQRDLDIIIAGTQKCGTSSLHMMLEQHPKIVSHGGGQWPYFLHEDDYLDQYRKFMSATFRSDNSGKLLLSRDTSVSASSIALSRLVKITPHIKIILMIRNPIDRAYSAYTFAQSKQYEVEATFEEGLIKSERFLDDINKYLVRNYIPLGFYHQTMKRMETYFSESQCLVLKAEDLKSRPNETLGKVFDFLHLENFSIEPMEVNRTRKARGGFIQRLTKTDNAIRNLSRELLPLSARQFILRSIGKVTTSKTAYEPMSPEVRTQLEGIFAADLANLKREYGIDYIGSSDA